MDAMRMVGSADSYTSRAAERPITSPAKGNVSTAGLPGTSNTTETAGDIQSTGPELKNVVSRSSDGDTLQVNSGREEEKRRRRDGQVTEKDDKSRARQLIEERRAAEEKRRQAIKERIAAEEAKKQIESEQQNNSSFAGKSVSDIERMYQQGIISRSVYEKQKAIKEEDNQRVTDNLVDFAKKSGKISGTLSKAELDQMAVSGAFGDNSNDGPVSAKERLDAMDRITEAVNKQQATITEGKRTWQFQLQA